MKNILEEVIEEIKSQRVKHPAHDHPSVDPVLTGRSGGATPQRMCEQYEIPTEPRAKFMCDEATKRGELTWAHIAVEEMSEVVAASDDVLRRGELVQLAAVLVSWIDCIDRHTAYDSKQVDKCKRCGERSDPSTDSGCDEFEDPQCNWHTFSTGTDLKVMADLPSAIEQLRESLGASDQSSAVNHPTHYGGENNPYEAIKVIHAWGMGFSLGNAVKYISRAGKKDPSKEVEDLEKAVWYINNHIERLKSGK